ncbi:D-alanyl-D-alanine carboxypeptidase family protein [Clostridium thermarum]|uniref:D-alanyl-D-alanine carboxypeptidase family protein n=1 Tax=Clostridium thermarum TaxID=1716543 RepID=UPI00112069C0|nr:D-alanyl-D-alanine carboxypeptidase family protein [Clostridium thermarum]
MKKLKFSLLLTLALSITSSIMPSAKPLAAENPPEINGLSAITLDYETGEIIYAKNIDEKRYPASTTKLMTSLLLAENKQKSDIITYTESAYKQPEYALRTNIYFNLKVGDTFTAEDTMKALLLFSANDAAYMVADNVGGNVENFIKMMNDKAKAIGMNNSNFVTANGLHDDNHYTTAYDLALLGRAAMENPWVRETAGTKKDMITLLTTGQPAYVENRNKLVGVNGNIGGKTGYTSLAGKCLVSVYERDGRKIVGVVMKAAYDAEDTMMYKDMEAIIDYSYKVQKTVTKPKGTTIDTVTLEYKPLKFFGPKKTIEVPVVINDDVNYYENDINKSEIKYETKLNDIDPWALSQDTAIGSLVVTQRNALATKEIALYPTISASDLRAANTGFYIGVVVGAIGIIALLILLISVIRRGSRRRRSY